MQSLLFDGIGVLAMYRRIQKIFQNPLWKNKGEKCLPYNDTASVTYANLIDETTMKISHKCDIIL